MASHLTLEERQFLYRLKKQGTSKSDMARLMKRDRSTINRELNRDTGGRGYRTPSEVLAKRIGCN